MKNSMHLFVKASVVVLLGAINVVSATPGDGNLYKKAYRIMEKIYYIEQNLHPDQSTYLDAALNRMEGMLAKPNHLFCGDPIIVFKIAYKWARSDGGLNDISSDAEAFANFISNQYCSLEYFDVFAPAFKFASLSMDKIKSEAKKVALAISNYEAFKIYPGTTLSFYRESYDFAYSSNGMNKTRREAEQFAQNRCLK